MTLLTEEDPTLLQECLAQAHQIGVVHGQDRHSHPADGGPANEPHSIPTEVTPPALRPGLNNGVSFRVRGSRPAMFGPLWPLQWRHDRARLLRTVWPPC